MEYTTFGKTGLRISKLGFGGWGIGGGAPVLRWADMWKADDEESKKSLKRALELGINFFDTAYVYADGHSERLIGEVFKDKDVIIATKIPPKNMHWPVQKGIDIKEVFPKDYIIEMAYKSFENFGKRTIDLLQLHVWTDTWVDVPDWQEAFKELKDKKIANFFGVSISNHDPGSVLKLADSGKIDTIQTIYNIFDQSSEDELFPIARKRNLGIIARVPLDEGSLGGKFSYDTTFNDWRKDYFTKERLKETVDRVNKLKEKFENEKRTIAEVALKFCLSNDDVDVVIPGMRQAKHVGENVKALDIKLTKNELAYLKKNKWDRNFYPTDT